MRHTERGDEPHGYVFAPGTISIGRAGDNDLPLEDPDRMVSKRHAEVRFDGERLAVSDLGSKNFTFVNGQRVAEGVARPLAEGDVLRIGPFEVAVALEREAPPPGPAADQTVFGLAFENPFREEAEGLAEALGRLRRAFAEVGYTHRGEALREALNEAVGSPDDADALVAVVSSIAPGAGPAPVPPPAASPPASASPWDLAPVVPAGPSPGAGPGAPPPWETPGPPLDPFAAPPGWGSAGAPPAGPAGPPPLAPPAAASAGAPDAAAFDALCAAVARLVSIPGQFKHEFVGQTVVYSPEAAFLYEADAAALRAYLGTADPYARAERLAALAEAAEDVLHHQLGMLEGYRGAVRAGAELLLDAVDPARLEAEEADAEGGLGRLLPGARERALLDRIRARCEELRAESFAAAERRVFRPAFVRAYLAHTATTDAPR